MFDIDAFYAQCQVTPFPTKSGSNRPTLIPLYIIDADEKRVFLVGPIGAISGCISGEADW